MLRSLLAGLLLTAVSFSTLVAPAGAASITISPPVGDQAETFVVAGEGLEPGMALDINFESPNGTVFSTAALNKVIVVDPDGEFALEIVPAAEFLGEPGGTWLVQVCVAGTDQCVQTDFEIEV